MYDSFDDLFDDFFTNSSSGDTNEKTNSKIDEARKIIDMLLNSGGFIDEEDLIRAGDALGEPDEIENYSDEFMNYEKRVWHTPDGDITRIIGSDKNKPFNDTTPIQEKTIEERLQEAIDNENYEEAAKLRDSLAKPNKPRKGRKKSN